MQIAYNTHGTDNVTVLCTTVLIFTWELIAIPQIPKIKFRDPTSKGKTGKTGKSSEQEEKKRWGAKRKTEGKEMQRIRKEKEESLDLLPKNFLATPMPKNHAKILKKASVLKDCSTDHKPRLCS